MLGWSPKHTITDDLVEYFEGYKAAGKVEAEPDFNKVRVILLVAYSKKDHQGLGRAELWLVEASCK